MRLEKKKTTGRSLDLDGPTCRDLKKKLGQIIFLK